MQREFPHYHCWVAASGLCYARPREARPGDPAPVNGGDPDRLWEAIIQHQAGEAAARDAAIGEILAVLFGPSLTPGSP